MGLAILVFIVNMVKSRRSGTRVGNDPWLADTLEWYATSPPPEHNFPMARFPTSRATGRSATSGSGSANVAADGPATAPGPWLRLTAVAAVAATALVVATGEESGVPHQATVLGALALTLGVAAAAYFGHRDRPALVLASSVALGLFVLQIGIGAIVAVTSSPAWADGSPRRASARSPSRPPRLPRHSWCEAPRGRRSRSPGATT